MAKISDYVKVILAGGLPAGMEMATADIYKQGDTRPEQTKPKPNAQNYEPFALVNQAGGINPLPLVIGGAVVLAVVTVIVLARRK